MKIDLFIGIGETISSYCSLFKNAEFFTTTADFLNSSAKLNIENKAILLKGSRSFKFEKIANIFEEKSHEKWIRSMPCALSSLLSGMSFAFPERGPE